MGTLLYHLVLPSEWEASDPSAPYAPSSLGSEGFVHLSTEAQVLPSATRHFASAAELILLSLDRARLGALRFEPAHGELFPHHYGAIARDMIVDTETLRRDARGHFVWR